MCLVAILALPLFTPRLYGSDEIKYFVPLRSFYFDRDLHYANEYAHFISRDPVAHAGLEPYMETVTSTGHRLNDAPIGSAFLWAPFYVVADVAVVVARTFGVNVQRDGYGWPYTFAVCLGSLVWGTAGLFLTYRLCRKYASRMAASLSVISIWFASPLILYLYITPPMAHANSMFAVALYLLVWHETRQRSQTSWWAFLGVTAGLMVLVRELNWLFLLTIVIDELTAIFVFSKSGLKRSETLLSSCGTLSAGLCKQIQRKWRGYLTFAVLFGVVVAPQFFVYLTLHGTFGPSPFILEKFLMVPSFAGAVLFSGFHGLFSWHPVTFLGVLGLIYFWRYEPLIASALALVFIVQVAVIGSYETWWGGASFGARRFINCLPIFALGLAVVLTRLQPFMRRVAAFGLAFLVIWNLGLAMQYSAGLIPRDRPVMMKEIVYNQFFEVPSRLSGIAWRFAFDRSSFYRTRQ